MTAALVTTFMLLAFEPTIKTKPPKPTKYYEVKQSFKFHNDMMWAVRDGKDGLIYAFLNKDEPAYREHERAFNDAAFAFHCLPQLKGGTFVLHTSEDDRANFIATDLRVIHGLPETAVPPVAVYFRDQKPVSWTSLAQAAVTWPASVDAAGAGGDGTSAGARSTNWTSDTISAWAFGAINNVDLVRSAQELEAFHAAHEERVVGGFFPKLCNGDSIAFQKAVGLAAEQRKQAFGAGAEGLPPLPLAISTNMTLGREVCDKPKLDLHNGGLCAMLGRAPNSPRLTMPPEAPRTSGEMAEWIVGMTRENDVSRKDEIHDEVHDEI